MSSYRPPSKLLDLDITILSAKHLHNSNWRQGDLKPYVSFWIEPNRRFTTKTDDSGSTRPIWNERFTLPINLPLSDALLSLEISHSGDTSPPVVGSVQLPLELINSDNDSKPIQTLELRRPSGRPQGKIRVKLSIRERERERVAPPPSPPPPDYHIAPPPNYYYSTALPPPPPPRDYRAYTHPQPSYHSSPAPSPSPSPSPSPYSYTNYDPYSSYYSGGTNYYNQLPPPPPPPRPYFNQGSHYGGGVGQSSPSAPVDYSGYDQRNGNNKMGMGTGLAVGAVTGSLGGLALDEGLKHEEEKIAERVEKDTDGRENYGRDSYGDSRVKYYI